MNRAHVGDEFFGRKNWKNGRREKRSKSDHRGSEGGSHPAKSSDEDALDRDSAGGEEHRIDGREIVMLSMHDDEFGKRDEIGNTERAIATALARHDQPNEAAQPEWKSGRIHDEDLLGDELEWTKDDILVAVRDVLKELERWPMVLHLPKQVWRREGDGDYATEPNPSLRKVSALACEQEPNNHAHTEED